MKYISNDRKRNVDLVLSSCLLLYYEFRITYFSTRAVIFFSILNESKLPLETHLNCRFLSSRTEAEDLVHILQFKQNTDDYPAGQGMRRCMCECECVFAMGCIHLCVCVCLLCGHGLYYLISMWANAGRPK